MLPSKRTLTIFAIFLGISLGFYYFQSLFTYLLLSAFVTSLLRPLTEFLASHAILGIKIPRMIAVLLSLVVLVSFPVLFASMLVPLVSEQANILQKINYQDVLNTFQSPLSSIENFLIQNIYPDRKTGFLLKELTELTTQFVKSLDFSYILQNILSVTGSVLVYVSAVFFLTFMLLYENNLLRKQFLTVIPNAYFELIVTTLHKIEVLLRSYLLGLMMQIGIFFVVMSISLSIFGVKYAFTIAIFVAIFNLIPYLGVGIGFVFASLVTLSTDTAQAHTLWDFAVALGHLLPAFVLAITLDSILVQPIIFSKSVKAHPLEIFGAVVAGATLGGGLGMLLAIPIYTTIKVGYTEWQEGHKKYRVFRQN